MPSIIDVKKTPAWGESRFPAGLLVATEVKMRAVPRRRWAAIVTVYRLAKHQGPTSRPLVKATRKRLTREYGKPSKQAKGFTSEAMHHNRTRRSARFASRSRCETLLVQRSGIAAAP